MAWEVRVKAHTRRKPQRRVAFKHLRNLILVLLVFAIPYGLYEHTRETLGIVVFIAVAVVVYKMVRKEM